MQSQAIIDLDHLEKYIAGDASLRDEVLELYCERVAYLGEQLETAQTDDAWKNTVHAIKGAARGIGVWALGDLCQDAEALLGPANADKRGAIAAAIQREIKASAAEAQSLRGAE